MAEHPGFEECEDYLTASLATLQDHLREWEAERDWWYNERDKTLENPTEQVPAPVLPWVGRLYRLLGFTTHC